MRFTWLAALVVLVAVAGCEATSDPETGSGGEPGDGSGSGSGDGSGGDEGPACGPHNCDGCCDGDQCLAGASDDSCGGGGAACQACGAYGECDAAAICVIARESRWDVVVESATVNPLNPGGTPWDGDAPDVYAQAYVTDPVTLTRSSPRTQAIAGTSPVWNTMLVSNIRGGALEGLAFELFDEDGNADDRMGHCNLAPVLDDLHGSSQILECPRSPSACLGTFSQECRAGWTLRYHLVARSSPRAGAAPVTHHALPAVAGPIGECSSREDTLSTFPGGSTSTVSRIRQFDSYGRRTLDDHHNGEVSFSFVEATCSSLDAPCDAHDGLAFERYETSSTGRHLVERNGGRYLEVHRYDSLGRLVRTNSYFGDGSPDHTIDFRFRASRLEVNGTDVTFDARGRIIKYTSPANGLVYEMIVEPDDDGLPARGVQNDADGATHETVWTFTGAGCGRRAPIEWTNGPVRL